MLEKTKKNSAENGWPMLLWGWLILIACISNYGIYYLGHPEISWIAWPILMPAGGITQFLMELKRHKTKKVSTFAEKAVGWVWIGCGSAMFIIAFVAPMAGIITWEAISPLIALIIGIGSVATAKIIDWKLLFYLSLLWWITGIALMFINPFFHDLFFSIIVISAYLIPGYILRNNYKKA